MTRGSIIAIIVVALLVVVGVLWTRARRIAQDSRAGFREFVRDPALQARISQSMARDDAAVERLATLPPNELVAELLDDDRYILASRAVREAGPGVVPALINALTDPTFRREQKSKDRESEDAIMVRTEPLITVLECLDDFALAPNDALPGLAPLVDDQNDDVRRHAALLIGSLGAEDAVEPLLRSLSDDDAYVRSYAMMGILRAYESGRLSEGFRTPVYNAMEPLVFRSDETVSGNAPRCLLKLDRVRAVAFLTSRENLVAGREGLHDALKALREDDVDIQEDVLLELAQILEGKAEKYPNDYALGEALRFLARFDSQAAQAAIARGMESKAKLVQENATEAFAAKQGVHEPYGFAFDHLHAVGWSRLTEPQGHVLAVRIFIDEVTSGGISQYLLNSGGDQWKTALAGLEAIGATSDIALLRTAVAMFGPDGPSTDTDKRRYELARVVKHDDEVFDPLETKFYEDEPGREVLLLKYIISHAEDFTDRSK